MPTMRCTRSMIETAKAMMQYKEKINELKKQNRLDDVVTMEKALARKNEDYLIFAGVANAKDFE